MKAFCFDNSDEVVRVIMENVENMFAEIKEDDNQENQD